MRPGSPVRKRLACWRARLVLMVGPLLPFNYLMDEEIAMHCGY